MKKYLAEFIGTFALVFCGTGAIVINEATAGAVTHPGIAFTFGLIVMVMIYALGPVSGAHLNPAVTIAFALVGKFPSKEVAPYVLSQAVGAFIASGTLLFMFPLSAHLGSTLPVGPASTSLILEFLLTFFLMLVIIQVSTGSKEQGMFAGLAIGGTVLLEAMFAGPICGASMNPARSLAPALVSGTLQHLWIYILAPIAGAVTATFVSKALSPTND
jgi:aquaporin Z